LTSITMDMPYNILGDLDSVVEIEPTCLKVFLVISRIAVNMYRSQSGNILTRLQRY
jgi:hypothetical protein